MFRDPSPLAINRQRGFLLPLAMFIVVGLAVLALAMSRTGSNTMTAVVQDSIAVQAFFAADSGAQYALHQILFNAADSTEAESRCNAVNGGSLSFNADGLRNCSASFTCARLDSLDGGHIFSVQSAARCGSGSLWAERAIEVGASYRPD